MLRVLAVATWLAGCASDGGEAAAEREAAYQQCLKDSMAVAMAWEAIEEMCRERTDADDPLKPQ
jgi:hypothetical protein